VVDNKAPQITCPKPLSINASEGSDEVVVVDAHSLEPVSVSDNSGHFEVTPISALSYRIGNTSITRTVADASGNIASCSFSVCVIDTQPPTFTNCVNSSTLSFQSPNEVDGVRVSWAALQVTDNDPKSNLTQSSNYKSGSVFPIGTTKVTISATDNSNNTAICLFLVEVTATVNNATTSTEAASSTTTLNTATLIGISIGSGVVIIFVLILVLKMRRMRRDALKPHDFAVMLQMLYEQANIQTASDGPRKPREIKRDDVKKSLISLAKVTSVK
jgi:hypothetical protein